MRRTSALFQLLFIAATAQPLSTHAQEPAGAVPGNRPEPRPGVLGAHEFVPSSYVRDPFGRTYLRTALGFGLTPEFETPVVTINDSTFTGVKGNLLFAVMVVEYQHAIRDWLALHGVVRVTGRLANETQPLLSQGVTLYSDFSLGWLVRLVRTDRVLLSGSLGVRSATMTDVYLQRFIDGIIRYGGVTPGNELVQSTPTMQGGVGLHCAYVLTELTGLTVSGNLDYGESMARDASDTWYYNIAAAFDFNLRAVEEIPLGFVVGAKTGLLPDLPQSGVRAAHTLFGRIAYTGAQDFALGLDMSYDFLPVRDLEGRQGFLSAVVDVRLFF